MLATCHPSKEKQEQIAPAVSVDPTDSSSNTPRDNESKTFNTSHLFSGVEHLGLQTQDLFLGHCRLPRDLRVLTVKGVRPGPLAPERL